MKSKTLQKKIRRLETRLEEGPRKLAKLKRKLEAQLAAEAAKARKKSAAKAAAKRRALKASAKSSQDKRPAATKPSAAQGPGALRKVKKKRSLSPERRAQLSAAMKARWVAKRAALAANPPSGATDQGFRVADPVQSSESRQDGV